MSLSKGPDDMRSALAILILTWASCSGLPLFAQSNADRLSPTLTNAGMEEASGEGGPAGWKFKSRGAGVVQMESSGPFAGAASARLDSTAAQGSEEDLFTNLMQSIDAGEWKGKKVRFRAAVRTADLTDTARVQMWFRVDRESKTPGERNVGAFDNMQDRPINSAAWKHYDIVLPVDADAQTLNVGIFIIGKGRAWFDDVSLEVVDDATPATGRAQLSPAVMRAFAEAESAPQQPFYTPWLWLALLAILLSTIAMLPSAGPRGSSFVRKGAFRFAAIYWLLYCGPGLIESLVPFAGATLARWDERASTWIAEWMARNVFHLTRELVPPNGSGDTTYNYLLVLAFFVISLAGTVVWSLLDRRTTDDSGLRDVLRIGLRYALAFILLSYGLSKVTFEMNQFPQNTAFQLDKTWGDSSPMNVLWAFMGASRPYTFFAGMAEILGAMLLVWRRTAILGALVALGTMSNVMLLNYCYDVPVKLFSTHLVMMSIMILLPDARRLVNVFLLNRPAEPAPPSGLGQGRRSWWIHAVAKTAVIGFLFVLPLGSQAWKVSRHLTRSAAAGPQEDGAPSKYRLTKRGYRWINEVPFNR
jgi:uncharacterized membrane protein YphA (DoxX/SURF4 family)